FEVLRVETQGLGRHFLSSWRGPSRMAERIEGAYAGSSHRPLVLLAVGVVNAALDLIRAGQVISVYAQKWGRSRDVSPPLSPRPSSSPRLRRGRRRRTLWDMGA
ncbi:hypothetical protein HYY27_04805, partial [bacterium]|nr:hypothetical protein [bacterium]